MDKQVYLYYNHNISTQKIRNLKSGTKSISIIKVPEHISLVIHFNNATYDGFILPAFKYIIFKENNNKKGYNFIYNLLFPKPNLPLALCNVENNNDVVRQIAISIIKGKATKKNIDLWKDKNNVSYIMIKLN